MHDDIVVQLLNENFISYLWLETGESQLLLLRIFTLTWKRRHFDEISALAALKVAKMTTFFATRDENFHQNTDISV